MGAHSVWGGKKSRSSCYLPRRIFNNIGYLLHRAKERQAIRKGVTRDILKEQLQSLLMLLGYYFIMVVIRKYQTLKPTEFSWQQVFGGVAN